VTCGRDSTISHFQLRPGRRSMRNYRKWRGRSSSRSRWTTNRERARRWQSTKPLSRDFAWSYSAPRFSRWSRLGLERRFAMGTGEGEEFPRRVWFVIGGARPIRDKVLAEQSRNRGIWLMYFAGSVFRTIPPRGTRTDAVDRLRRTSAADWHASAAGRTEYLRLTIDPRNKASELFSWERVPLN